MRYVLVLLVAGFLGTAAGAELRLRDFGAKGDGAADETDALVAAFAELGRRGGTLELGAGTYRFRGLLKIEGLENAAVDAAGAVLVNAANEGGFQFDRCRDFTWRGGVLRYAETPTENTKRQHPLYFTNGENLRIEGVAVRGSPFMGLVVNGCRRVWLVDNQVDDTQRDGIHTVYSSDVVCTGNRVENTKDDAIAFIDYGDPKAVRTERILARGNIIRNCRQGLVVVGGGDVLIADNLVERTTYSGVQVTTNDRFNARHGGAVAARRVKVTNNRLIESGGRFVINGEDIPNHGQVTTGRAAIVASYIDKEKGWNRDGDGYFALASIPLASAAVDGEEMDLEAAADGFDELFPGRIVQVEDAAGATRKGRVVRSARVGDRTKWRFAPEGTPLPGATGFRLSRILTDIDILGNEILRSHVNGIHTNGVYRLRVMGNKIYNANGDDAQWTGTVVEILGGRWADFVDNWILDDRSAPKHRKPYAVTARDVRNENNRVN